MHPPSTSLQNCQHPQQTQPPNPNLQPPQLNQFPRMNQQPPPILPQTFSVAPLGYPHARQRVQEGWWHE